jgi:Zn-finger protein
MMSARGHHEDHVKRIVLPSGRTIDVVCFGKAGSDEAGPILPEAIAELAASPAARAVESPDALHVCPECDCALVYPCDWEEATGDAWNVSRRCPNCEWTHSGVFAQDLLEEFDEELDRGLEELAADLKRLVRANMAEEIDRFASALEADAILPMDF